MTIYDTPEYHERWAMYQSALQAGIPIVSRETCAIICAMLNVWGNNEAFTHNHRLVCELRYAQKRFGIEGGSTPTDRQFPNDDEPAQGGNTGGGNGGNQQGGGSQDTGGGLEP